jgi:hypothetical protein
MFAAILDTCVLWPSLQRDVLLSFAIEGIYRPVWSSAILDELEYHEEEKLVERDGVDAGVARSRAVRLIAMMRAAFDDAEAQGWEALDGTFGLPDVDDEHVVAAAVVAGAGVIVTHNLRDFSRDRVPASIDLQAPAEFAHNTVSLNPPAAFRAIEAIAMRSGRHGPILSTTEILEILEGRYGFLDAVAVLRDLA